MDEHESNEKYNDILTKIRSGEFNSEEVNRFGLELIRLGYLEDAEKIFSELLEKEKELYRGRNLNNLGLVFLAKGNIGKARENFKQAYEFDVKEIGEEKAKENPAWRNIQTTNQIIHGVIPLKKVEQKIKEVTPEGEIPEIEKMFYGDFLLGGIVAGCVLFLLQLVLGEELLNLDPLSKILIVTTFILIAIVIFLRKFS